MTITERARRGIRRYSPSDREALLDFQLRMFGDGARQLDAERFAWLFERNPFRSPDGPGIWLCRRDGAIVGQQAEIPFILAIDGVSHRAAWAIDLMVDPTWRLRGVGPALTETQLRANEIVAAVTLSDGAYRSFRRSGWEDIGVVPTFVRPLDVRRSLPGVWSQGLRRWLVGPALSMVLKIDELFVRILAIVLRTDLTPVESFDERVDAVWTNASQEYKVLRRRDSQALKWFFDDRPDRASFRRYYLRRKERIVGYLVVRIRTEDSGPVAVVMDYLAAPRLIPMMLARLIEELGRECVAVRMRTLNVKAKRKLALSGFVRADRDALRPLHLLANATIEDDSLRARLSDRRSWFFTSGDTDLATHVHR